MVTAQEEFDRRSDEDRKSTPKPDPTDLTREALLREIAALRTLIDQRISATEALFETKIQLGREGGMALKELFSSQMADLREVLNERYQTQTKALDAAFVAQQAAVATSFDASEKAMAAALLAAKEAVEKANLATEKRFDSLNELLAQQNSTLSLLLPRAEFEGKLFDLDRRVTEVKSTVDKTGAVIVGAQEQRVETRAGTGESRANIGVYIAMATLVLSVLIIAIAVIALKP